MGLFSRKKAAPAAAPTPAPAEKKPAASVNPDDIWGAPKKKSKFADESTEAMNEPVSIDPETVKKKMEAMERELEEQKNKPAAAYEPISQVADEEVLSAQARYEEQYKLEHERYIATHQEDIEQAIGDDDDKTEVDKRIDDIVEERDRRAEETSKILGDIEETDPELMKSGMDNLGVAKDETLDPDYKNINEVAAEEVDNKLGELGVAKDVTLDKDYQNIKELTADDVEAKTKEFLEKYGDRKREE